MEVLWYYFGICSSELAQLVPILILEGRQLVILIDPDFSVTIPRCYKDVYVNRFFPCPARLWNSLPLGCFTLTYDLDRFKSRINGHLLTAGFF